MRNLTRTAVAAATVAFCTAGLGGCAGGGGTAPTKSPAPANTRTATAPGTGPASPAAARITIKSYTFRPAALTVRPGALINVVNQDSVAHTVTATGPKAFDTGDIGPGTAVTFTAPTKPGNYPYACTIHPYMKGSLSVR